MDASRTTPSRPLDVTELFPRLAPLARTATRLHPCPGSPSSRDSSVGGPLLWPADEPWPRCDGPHGPADGRPAVPLADVRLERRVRAAAHGRSLTPQERETLARIRPARDRPTAPTAAGPDDGSTAMLPLAQLYVRDVPGLPAPAGTDLLQVLWCPFDHPPLAPRTELFWRSAAKVTDTLVAPPEPSMVQFDHYVPEPCLLAPEQITEYPHPMELSEELRDPLGEWSRWQIAGAAVNQSYESCPEDFYRDTLSVAPGWKVGGWASWGCTDPAPRLCPDCDAEMDPLLTVHTFEWDHNTRSWIPGEGREHRARAEPSSTATPDTQALIDFFRAQGIQVYDRGHVRCDIRDAPPVIDPIRRQPTAIRIGSGGGRQQLYVCPTSPEHRHIEHMQ
ncbi:hypothetical protein [Streptomyces sp. NPDC002580]|uniref:hypothetical protein n=1 Tax=Streptomyces sp. NPDC002580 TaxID=3364653 RepID=UPI00369904FA